MKILFILSVLFIDISITLAIGVYRVKLDSGSNLNIRESPNTSSAIVGTINEGKLIYVQSISNGWAKFYKGYCYAQYLIKVTNGSTYSTTSDLNFRNGPGTSYDRIEVLNKGSTVIYYGIDPWNSDWGVTDRGYCNINYLTSGKVTTKVATVTGPVTPKTKGSINLYTKEYKQYNYEYEYVRGCNPTCTIHRYGCLITSITMALNQIEKKNYTPVDVAKIMTFNSDGDATSYGSSNFKAIRHSTIQPALQALLNSLRNGRIAIFGSSGPSGWHFVAVYGYNGNYKSPLNTVNFLIHDPGFNNRSNLSLHITVYPNSPETIVYN